MFHVPETEQQHTLCCGLGRDEWTGTQGSDHTGHQEQGLSAMGWAGLRWAGTQGNVHTVQWTKPMSNHRTFPS